MKELMEFLKKHLVLVICVAVAVMILGAGIWFLVSPDQPNVPDHSQTTESTGELSTELDTDTGFVNSGIVNIPGGDSDSGEVTPITPENENTTGNNANVQTPSVDTNTGNSNQQTSNGSTNNSNNDSGNSNSQQTPSGSTDSGNSNQQTPSGSTDSGNSNQGNSQTGTVDVTGSVVPNPFN